MTDKHQFSRWALSEGDMKNINPVKARDLIANCFFEAQRETIARAKEKLHKEVDTEGIKKSIALMMRTVFTDLGYDYNQPTKESLMNIVQDLAHKSKAWGTPEDIIEYHKGQIQKVLGAL